jgi:hypothetical protein
MRDKEFGKRGQSMAKMDASVEATVLLCKKRRKSAKISLKLFFSIHF